MSEIAKRYATDEAFREVADLLYGGGVEIYKLSPDQSDLNARKKREKTQARIGLATNVVGIGAGLAATPGAFKAVGEKRRELKGLPPKKTHRGTTGKVGSIRRVISKPKVAYGLALGGAGLQVGNLAGDAIANRVLARAAKDDPRVKGGTKVVVEETRKKTKDYIHKSLEPWAQEYRKKAKPTDPQPRGMLRPIKQKVKKNQDLDITWEGEISKLNIDKQQVFGWASIVEMNGEKVVDLQGDYIAIDEVEKSAYEYVHKSRKGGDMHLRDGDEPVVKSHMIESFVVTPEKKKALGLPEDTPTGWWVGYQINDQELWDAVKSGKRTGFSIHGRGVRSPM